MRRARTRRTRRAFASQAVAWRIQSAALPATQCAARAASSRARMVRRRARGLCRASLRWRVAGVREQRISMRNARRSTIPSHNWPRRSRSTRHCSARTTSSASGRRARRACPTRSRICSICSKQLSFEPGDGVVLRQLRHTRARDGVAGDVARTSRRRLSGLKGLVEFAG